MKIKTKSEIEKELLELRQRITESEASDAERYRRLVEFSPDGIVVHCEGKIVYANNAALKFAGATEPEQLIGKTVLSFVHPDYRDSVKKRIRQVMEGKEAPLFEEKFISLDGAEKDVEVAAISFTWENKPAVQVVFRDISEWKHTQEMLQKSERKYRLISERTSDSIAITTFGFKPTYLYVSPSVKTLLGYEPEELIGESVFKFVHPDDKKKMLPLLKRYFSQKAKIFLTGRDSEVSETIEYRAIAKSGNWHYFQSTVNFIGNDLLFISRDITDKKQIEEALRNSEKMYRTMIENSNDMIWMLDKKGNFDYSNKRAEELTGYNLKDWLGKGFAPMIPADDLPRIQKIFTETVKGKSQHYDVDVIKSNGSIITLSVNATPLFQSGEIIGAVNFGRDITDRQQYIQKIEQASTEWRETFDSISDIVILTSQEYEILRINRAGCELTGKNPEALIGKKCYEVIHGLDRPIDGCPCRKASQTKKWENSEFSQDGRFYITTAAPVSGKNNKISAFAHTVHDITKRKQAEEALRRTEDIYRRAIASADAVPYQFQYVSNSYEYIGEGIVQLTGYTAEEMNPTLWRKIIKQSILYGDAKELEWDEAVRQTRAGKFERWRSDNLIATRDGQERWIADASVEIRNAEGVSIGSVGILIDITERKLAENELKLKTDQIISSQKEIESLYAKSENARKSLLSILQDVTGKEQALRKSEGRFRDVASNTGDWIWELDKEGRYTYNSPVVQKVIGYEDKEVLGKYFYDFFHPDERDELKKAAFEVFKQKEVFKDFINRNVHKDGHVVILETSGVPLLDDSGNLLGYRGVDRDVTERKQAEEELQKRLRELEIYYKATMGREGRIIELKQQVNELLAQLGKAKKYDV
ncbi:PAS domain S-box protein [bacterium]|nr:PAS domain S-box protein [bacterium]